MQRRNIMSKFIPQNFNDLLALVLIAGIVALWIMQGFSIVTFPAEVTGALIVTWTLVVQYYFRKEKGGN
jgi:hypothetical protein